MSEFKIDAYSPDEMSERVKTQGVTKANLDFWSTFVLAILAGAFISFGALFFTLVVHDANLPFGLTRLLGGLVFCIGLILVIIAGAELFTGNSLIIMAYVSREVTTYQLLRNWVIVYIGNLAGALSMVYWVYLSRHWQMNSYLVGAQAVLIANAKVSLPFMVAFIRGVLCNVLVCLAVWLCFSGRSVTDKILAILFPITAFVALGFEHSIANMYFIPLGILLKSDPKIINAITNLLEKSAEFPHLTTGGFLHNLIPVTLGNIFGGVILVGTVYWFIYLKDK